MSRLRATPVYVSSEDDGYEVSNLLPIHSMIAAEVSLPSSRNGGNGWSCEPFSEFPQEVGLRFCEGAVELTHISILTHEIKTPARIDVYAGITDQNARSKYGTVRWEHMGFISFAGHSEERGYHSRELKSVDLRIPHTEYIRFLISEPHPSDRNPFHQVGVVGVGLFGQILQKQANAGFGPPLRSVSEFGTRSVPLNEFETILNELRDAKAAALRDEDYDTATQVKKRLDALEVIEVRISGLEREKRDALMEENFPLAQEIKRKAEDIIETALRGPRARPESHHEEPHEMRRQPQPPQTARTAPAEYHRPSTQESMPLPAMSNRAKRGEPEPEVAQLDDDDDYPRMESRPLPAMLKRRESGIAEPAPREYDEYEDEDGRRRRRMQPLRPATDAPRPPTQESIPLPAMVKRRENGIPEPLPEDIDEEIDEYDDDRPLTPESEVRELPARTSKVPTRRKKQGRQLQKIFRERKAPTNVGFGSSSSRFREKAVVETR